MALSLFCPAICSCSGMSGSGVSYFILFNIFSCFQITPFFLSHDNFNLCGFVFAFYDVRVFSSSRPIKLLRGCCPTSRKKKKGREDRRKKKKVEKRGKEKKKEEQRKRECAKEGWALKLHASHAYPP